MRATWRNLRGRTTKKEITGWRKTLYPIMKCIMKGGQMQYNIKDFPINPPSAIKQVLLKNCIRQLSFLYVLSVVLTTREYSLFPLWIIFTNWLFFLSSPNIHLSHDGFFSDLELFTHRSFIFLFICIKKRIISSLSLLNLVILLL